MPRPFRSITFTVAAISSAALLTLAASAQTMGTPERYTGSAININNGRADNIDITVNRWSTDKQRDTLMAVMQDQGPRKAARRAPGHAARWAISARPAI